MAHLVQHALRQIVVIPAQLATNLATKSASTVPKTNTPLEIAASVAAFSAICVKLDRISAKHARLILIWSLALASAKMARLETLRAKIAWLVILRA